MKKVYLSVLMMAAMGVASCVESDPDSDCTPNAKRCDGDEVQICNEEGTGWLFYQACDVGAECIDGVCGSTQNCGDAVCDADENCSVCLADCPCQAGETCVSGVCEADTPPDCPNGTCGADEDCTTCPADCGVCPTGPEFDCVAESCSFTECDGTVTGPELYFVADLVTIDKCTTQLPQWFTDLECFVPQSIWDDLSANPTSGSCYLYQWACPCVDGDIQWLHNSVGEGDDFTPSLPEPACDSMPQVCCTPDCTGQDCGDDGCGGSCGTCSSQEYCAGGTTCECPSGCLVNGICCGPPFCSGDCVGTPCC